MTNPSRKPDAAPPSEPAAVRAREALARKWSYLLSSVVVVALSRDELDAELGEQLDALCAALHGEPFDPAPFEEVGERLVALGYVNEPGLKRTVDVLGKGLLALDEFRAFEDHALRVVRGVGALTCGFTAARGRSILDQQESMQRSLLKAARDAQWDQRQSEAKFAGIAISSTNGILIVGLDGKVVWANDAIGEILGSRPEPGTRLMELVAPNSVVVFREMMERVLAERDEFEREPMHLLRGEDDLAKVTLTASLLRDGDDKPSHVLVVADDDTELALLQGELRRQSLHDVLTGLPNRQFFTTHLETVLRRADPEFGVTVFHLDLDAFGLVCNSLGGRVGEKLLQHVARRLRAVMSREQAMVARFNGDEFGIVVENSLTTPDLATIMTAINADLAEPVFVDDHGLAVSVSAGVVHRPSPDVDPAELLRMADLALRQAKKHQRGQWELFHSNEDTEGRRDSALAVVMPGAWEQGDIGVCYRPVRVLATGELAGVEAVLHWDLTDRCAELADATGLILPMGEWLIRIAAGQAQWWRQRGELDQQFGVRLTRHQATDADLVSRVAKVVDETGMPHERLTLSMPVGVLGVGGAAGNLETLADMGIRIALEDFGLGPRDLAWLGRLPVASVLVPADLVRRQDPRSTALIPAVHELGVDICVDGIENEAQAAWWEAAGADLAIGAHFGAPENAGDFLKQLG
ncbi:PAS domain S-box-containing protein/diguanylate cyclase (GGDEF) domain-containing protein [Lentzea xinjiangensis]|uniref:PAS domain S-box-containing protein/diguanylate cyclase (GGDEF) domain-containing protein n=1 Tax=Lentzea xinjiangensis TaxID=402600 RepID=A0A1H9DD89_9PSEU|nr:diguanylate cyclase [Lentzea xinjiangensis]SEQ11341.1 PAS domain S-box-containing protein/diguanylate cyclase (GGDEF) domain-containing protein [Lentzea xinjiangensis]